MSLSVYIAVCEADNAVADVLQVYLEHSGLYCMRREDVHVLLNYADDLQMTMNNCDVIVVLDSKAFRSMKNNWELHFAQTVKKPLVVISLDSPVDENASTDKFKLVNFTTPKDRDWNRLLETILGCAG